MRTLLTAIALSIALVPALVRAEPPPDRAEDAAEEAAVRALVTQESALLQQAQGDLSAAQQIEAQILQLLDE